MNSLQVWLAIAGGVVLAVVVAHGAWVARRKAPRQADPADGPTSPDHGEGAGRRTEPTLDGAAMAPLAVPAPERRPPLDALIDCLASIAVDGVVSGDAALAAMPATRRAGSKPTGIEGLNEVTGHWEFPVAGQRYRAFQAGVQLANRSGPLNEIEFSEFVVKAQAFADAVGGMPDFPNMLTEVARGRELDQFSGTHDAQLGFTLRARQTAWSAGYVHQQAARLGFVAGAIPGRLVLPGSVPGVPAILELGFDTRAALSDDPALSSIQQVTLSLDVPHVARIERPFVRLREAAQALAAAMDGVVTDDNGQPLSTDTLDRIGADLEQLYDALEERDLAAGSPQARRLFS
jgi:hypothetical protein